MQNVTVTLLNEGGMDKLIRTLGLGGVCMLVLAALAVLVLIKLGSILAALWLDSRYPELSDAMLQTYRNDPMRCLVVGLANVLMGVLLAIVLLNTKILALFGLALLLAVYVMGFVGYTVGYRSAGTTIPLSSWGTRTGEILLGGVVAESTFLIPILGQLLSLVTLLRGFGAVTLAIIARKKPASMKDSTTSESE